MNRWPRAMNIALGVWLFISAFIWIHSQAQFTNTWLVGAGFAVIGAISLGAPGARFLNAILAVWLFISAWSLPTFNVGTVWNNVLVSIAVFIFALIPTMPTAGAVGPFGQPPRHA